MKKRKNKKQKYIGIITSLLIITFVIMILSLIFNIIGINGQKNCNKQWFIRIILNNSK